MPTFAPSKRPVSVTIIAIGVFFLGIWNSWRVFALMQENAFIRDFAIRPDPRVRLVFALLWAIMFFALAILLIGRFRSVQLAIPSGLLLYATYNLYLLTFFVQSTYIRKTGVLQLVGYIVVVAFTRWILSRPGLHTYWKQ